MNLVYLFVDTLTHLLTHRKYVHEKFLLMELLIHTYLLLYTLRMAILLYSSNTSIILCFDQWMNECMRGRPSRPLHGDLVVYCASSFSVIPSATPHFEWSAEFWMWGRQSSHVVPKSIDPRDVILNKLKPHIHTGYGWLFHFLSDTSHRLDYYSVPVWRGVLWGDSVL
jgi:hypothetical protein